MSANWTNCALKWFRLKRNWILNERLFWTLLCRFLITNRLRRFSLKIRINLESAIVCSELQKENVTEIWNAILIWWSRGWWSLKCFAIYYSFDLYWHLDLLCLFVRLIKFSSFLFFFFYWQMFCSDHFVCPIRWSDCLKTHELRVLADLLPQNVLHIGIGLCFFSWFHSSSTYNPGRMNNDFCLVPRPILPLKPIWLSYYFISRIYSILMLKPWAGSFFVCQLLNRFCLPIDSKTLASLHLGLKRRRRRKKSRS